MSFLCKIISGLTGLIISAAACVKAHRCPQNNDPIFLKFNIATFINFFNTILPIHRLYFVSASGTNVRLETETPDFSEQISNPTLSCSKSKRGKFEIRGSKSGVIFPRQAPKQLIAGDSAFLSTFSIFLHSLTWKPYFLVYLMLLAFAGRVNSITRTASVSGNWNITATWGGAAVPVAGDDVVINSGVIVTVNTAGAVAASITVLTNTTSNNGLTITGTGTLVVGGAITMNVPTIGSSTIHATTCSLSAASISIPGSATTNRFCTVAVSTGTINVSGAISFSGTPAQARLLFTGSGTLNIGGDLSSGGTFTPSTGTVNCNGSSAQTVGGYSYNVLKVNNSAGASLLGASSISTLTIGDVTPNSVFDDRGFQVTSAGTLNLLSGRFKLGEATATTFPAFASLNITEGTTVEYASGINQAVAAITYKNLILTGSSVKTLGAGTIIEENLYISGTTVADLTGNANRANAFFLSGIQQSSGTWGSTVSSATNKNDTYFSGTGYLIIASPTPVFSGLSASQSICFGTDYVTLSGTVSALGSVYPAEGETVRVTINGVMQNAVIAGGKGLFSIDFNTTSLPASVTPYTITYAYAGDTNLNAAANNTGTSLTVNSVPSITLNPSNQTGCTGFPASFTVAATGIPSPVYQWRKGGTDISGATLPTFGIASVSATDAGSYEVKVTNSCGTITTAPATLTVNTGPAITSLSSDQTLCSGSPATLSVIAAGYSLLTYQWRKGNINIPGATSADYTIPSVVASDAGWYNVVITTSSCPSLISGNIHLTLYPVLVAGTHNINPLTECVGYNPAPLDFNTNPISGGQPPYSYQWRLNGTPITGESADNYNPPAPATIGIYSYDCVVTDGCGSGFTTLPKVITLVEDPSVSISGPSSVCRNTPVALTSTLTGGTGSITCFWQSSTDGLNGWNDIAGATSSTYSPSTSIAGIFYYQLHAHVSGAGCNDATSSPLTLTIFAEPTANAGGNQSTCANCGAVIITGASAGNQTSVSWSGGTGTFTNGTTLTPDYTPGASDITSGSVLLTLTATGNSPCSNATSTKTLIINTPPVTSLSKTDVKCKGFINGTVSVSISSGNGPYTYSWNTSPVQTTATATGLAAGTYIVTVTDVNNCTTTATAVIRQPAIALTASITSQTNVLCNGQNTGSVTVTATPGTGTSPYIYALGAGTYQATVTFNNLFAGSYTVHVKDYNDCILDVPVTITQSGAIIPVASSSNVVCGGSPLNLTGSATGGSGSYIYSWLGPNSFSSNDQNPTLLNAPTNASGTYTLTVKDANNCTANITNNVIVNQVPDVSITPIFTSGFVKKSTGSKVIYTFTINNTGAVADQFDLSSINVPDPDFYDLDARFLTTGGALLNNPISLSAGGSYTFQLELSVQGNAPKVLNHTRITATSSLCTSSNVSADVYTYEYNGNNPPDPTNAQLEISKTASVTMASVGNTFDYSITVVNNTTAIAAREVTITDQVPASLTITNTGGGTQSGNTITWYVGTLGKMAAVQKVITVRPSCNSVPSVSNTATVISIPSDNNTSDNTVTIQTPVSEFIPPVASCKTASVNLDATGQAVVTPSMINNSSTDDCGITLYEVSKSGSAGTWASSISYSSSDIGTRPVSLRVTDASGNSAICNTIVTLNDVTAPTITCPVLAFSFCAGVGGTYVVGGTGWDAMATDNCTISSLTYSLEGATTGTGTSLNGVAFNPGLTTITWTAKDASTNSASCLFSVTITPTPGIPVFTSGVNSTRCQGAGTITYTATAANNSGITYCLDAATCAFAGNSIVAGTGAVTYAAGWSGISIITASATGCNGPVTATHTVTVNPLPIISNIYHN
jgi:uncharacterized repeat protein (TIGR01451 family)